MAHIELGICIRTDLGLGECYTSFCALTLCNFAHHPGQGHSRAQSRLPGANLKGSQYRSYSRSPGYSNTTKHQYDSST